MSHSHCLTKTYRITNVQWADGTQHVVGGGGGYDPTPSSSSHRLSKTTSDAILKKVRDEVDRSTHYDLPTQHSLVLSPTIVSHFCDTDSSLCSAYVKDYQAHAKFWNQYPHGVKLRVGGHNYVVRFRRRQTFSIDTVEQCDVGTLYVYYQPPHTPPYL